MHVRSRARCTYGWMRAKMDLSVPARWLYALPMVVGSGDVPDAAAPFPSCEPTGTYVFVSYAHADWTAVFTELGLATGEAGLAEQVPAIQSVTSWVASVHAGERDLAPLGPAVVVDARRVLTCAHVVLDGKMHRQPLWVSFPKSDLAGDEWRLVESVDWAFEPPVTDVAVLVLDRDIPAGVEAAPLLFPAPGYLEGSHWWAFGFPYSDFLGQCDPVGDCADGLVGAALARGWVRLDTGSRYLVRPGFSGGGLWSPDYGAVVGIVGQAHENGDGRAITLHRVDQVLPGQKAAAADRAAGTGGR